MEPASNCYSPQFETAHPSYHTRGTCWNCGHKIETEDQGLVAWWWTTKVC